MVRVGSAAPPVRAASTTLAVVSRERLRDVVFLVVLSALPALFFVRGLGFYLDDYHTLMLMSTSNETSFWGDYTSLLAGDPKSHLRPLEYAVLAGLYHFFGADPFPHQVFLAALVPACAAMLYLVLVRLAGRRHVALAVSIVFALAPHYSSARFWVAAFSPTAVLTLYLVSLYCVLRVLDGHGRLWRLAGWVLGGCVAMLLSIFVYEIAMPLFVLTAAFFGWRAWRGGERGARLAAVAYAGVLLAAIAAKVALAVEVGRETTYSIGGYQGGLVHHIAYVTSGAVKINLGSYGVGLPYVVGWSLVHRFSWVVLVVSTLVGVLVFLYLARNAVDDRSLVPSRGIRWPLWCELVAAGLALIAVGYGLFVVTGQIYMTSVGIDNRVNIVPALGMAVVTVGLLIRVVQWIRPHWRRTAFSLGIAVLAAAGTLVTSTIADYWEAAYSRQQAVMQRLEQALPADPSRSTVLLDGVCPEIGPGIVFHGVYDLRAALKIAYADDTIEGALLTDDVVARRSAVDIGTTWLSTERHLYPYAQRLLAYDWARDTVVPIPDRQAARAYLDATPRLSCPRLRSFAWGIGTARWVPFG